MLTLQKCKKQILKNLETIINTRLFYLNKDKTISVKKMGWFNMNCFSVVYDPPIVEFE